MGKWTEEEERLMRELYPTTDNATLSRRLGRSVSAVENKASRIGLKKRMPKKEETAEEDEEGFDNPFELISREEALKLDKIDLLRINWSLSLMYQRELNNPDLTKSERHKLMNALSNHTSIINSIMKSAEEELKEEEEDLEAKFIKISMGEGAPTIRARRVRIDVGDLVEVE
jgi:hypothetical protein